jgi:hypothetical protein
MNGETDGLELRSERGEKIFKKINSLCCIEMKLE